MGEDAVFYAQIFDALLRAGVTDERLDLYRASCDAPDWSSDLGQALFRARDATPEAGWARLPQLATLRRLVLSVARLYLSKRSSIPDPQLAWELIQAGDGAVLGALAQASPEQAGKFSSVAAWAVREAVVGVLRGADSDEG